MSNSKGFTVWIETGYDLFAHEGHDGIQVERLARILGLNKSGFYHYFGDRESYFEQLMKHHLKNGEQYIKEINGASSFDPDYINIVVNHPLFMLVNMQLIRNKHIKLFTDTNNDLSARVGKALMPLWVKYLGLENQPELAHRYFEVVRDMVYSRLSLENMNQDFFHKIASEAKSIVDELHDIRPVEVVGRSASFLKQAG